MIRLPLCPRVMLVAAVGRLDATAASTRWCCGGCSHHRVRYRLAAARMLSSQQQVGGSGEQHQQQQRRRRRKTLVPSKSSPSASTVVTTRDRLRLLIDTNRVAPRKSLQETGNELLQVAQGRISWLRNRLFTHWNPDYKEGDAAAALNSQIRKFKHGAVMDGRWWMWNIAFALLPAMSIAAYCEFRGKRIQQNFHRRLELHQLKAAVGDNDWSVEKANAMLDARDAALREPDWIESAYHFMSQLNRIAGFILQPLQSPVLDETSDGNVKVDHRKTGPEGATTGSGVTTRQPAHALPDRSIPTGTQFSTDREPSVQELLYRIQQLEAAVSHTQSAGTDEDMNRRMQRELQRLNGSELKHRFADELQQKWNSTRDSTTDEQPLPTKALSKAETSDVAVESAEPLSLQDTVWNMVRALWTGSSLDGKHDENEQSAVVVVPSHTVDRGATVARIERVEDATLNLEFAKKGKTGQQSTTCKEVDDKSGIGEEQILPWWKRIWTR